MLSDKFTLLHRDYEAVGPSCYITQSRGHDTGPTSPTLIFRFLRWNFSGSGTPVATLPGVWLYKVSAGTGRPGVSILWLGEVERLICNFYLSVAARKIVWADPSLRYISLLLGR